MWPPGVRLGGPVVRWKAAGKGNAGSGSPSAADPGLTPAGARACPPNVATCWVCFSTSQNTLIMASTSAARAPARHTELTKGTLVYAPPDFLGIDGSDKLIPALVTRVENKRELVHLSSRLDALRLNAPLASVQGWLDEHGPVDSGASSGSEAGDSDWSDSAGSDAADSSDAEDVQPNKKFKAGSSSRAPSKADQEQEQPFGEHAKAGDLCKGSVPKTHQGTWFTWRQRVVKQAPSLAVRGPEYKVCPAPGTAACLHEQPRHRAQRCLRRACTQCDGAGPDHVALLPVQMPRPPIQREFNFFDRLLPEGIWQKMAADTNAEAVRKQQRDRGGAQLRSRWVPVTAADCYRFMAVLLVVGLNWHGGSYTTYWSTDG